MMMIWNCVWLLSLLHFISFFFSLREEKRERRFMYEIGCRFPFQFYVYFFLPCSFCVVSSETCHFASANIVIIDYYVKCQIWLLFFSPRSLPAWQHSKKKIIFILKIAIIKISGNRALKEHVEWSANWALDRISITCQTNISFNTFIVCLCIYAFSTFFSSSHSIFVCAPNQT